MVDENKILNVARKRKYIVVGVDPGTTTGYAILDLSGNIISVGSAKNDTFGNLVFKIISHGKAVFVGCDKRKSPTMVQKLATKLGAVLVSPEEDLLTQEKRNMLSSKKESVSVKNSHELDALASAFFAYNHNLSLIRKAHDFAKKNFCEESLGEILLLSMQKNISFSSALEHIKKLVESNKKNSFVSENQQKKILPKRLTSLKDLDLFREKLNSKEKEVLLLTEQRRRLEFELKKEKHRNSNLRKKLSKKERPTNNDFSRSLEHSRLRKQLEILSLEKDLLKKDNMRLMQLLYSKDSQVMIRKYPDLGWTSLLECEKQYSLKDGDLIFVNSPEIYSDRTLEFLKGKIKAILVRKKTPVLEKSGIDLIVPNVHGNWPFKLLEEQNFFVAKKQDINLELSNRKIIEKVLFEYKEERKKALFD